MLKVIGIGLPRTGTRSLAEALTILGYETKHEGARLWDLRRMDFEGPVESDFTERFSHLDAVTECLWWRDLVEAHPEADLILTVRGEEGWWRSIC